MWINDIFRTLLTGLTGWLIRRETKLSDAPEEDSREHDPRRRIHMTRRCRWNSIPIVDRRGAIRESSRGKFTNTYLQTASAWLSDRYRTGPRRCKKDRRLKSRARERLSSGPVLGEHGNRIVSPLLGFLSSSPSRCSVTPSVYVRGLIESPHWYDICSNRYRIVPRVMRSVTNYSALLLWIFHAEALII